MDAAGKQHLDLVRRHAQGDLLQQTVDHAAPQHEAAQRADVTAAFAPLEDEAPRAFLEEHRDQVG